MNTVVIIPAYRPGPGFVPLVRQLLDNGALNIAVVDDGSGAAFAQVFSDLSQFQGVTVLRHAVNLGKGAALKTAFNHVLVEYPQCSGVVTADADGQHEALDILGVGQRFLENPGFLVLGSRNFKGDVPWRNRMGNQITRHVVRWLTGQRLSDTQTGLRAIPRQLLPKLLRIQSSGYEFELDMLTAAKHDGLPIMEREIKTVYEPGNPSSHFDPLRDSLRIYFVLVRFTIVSLLSAVIDNAAFILAFSQTGQVLPSQVLGRAVSVCFNYPMARRAVFLSDASHSRLLPRYALLVFCSGLASYALARMMHSYLGYGVVLSKTLSEAALFILNFGIQRDLVFTEPHAEPQLKAGSAGVV